MLMFLIEKDLNLTELITPKKVFKSNSNETPKQLEFLNDDDDHLFNCNFSLIYYLIIYCLCYNML